MRRLADLRSKRSRRATLVVLTGVLVVSLVLFQSTVSVYIALDKVAKGDTTVTDITLDEEAEEIVLTVSYENPTGNTVKIVSTSLHTRVNGTLVTALAGGTGEVTTVDPHGQATITVRLPLRDDMLQTAREGFEREAASLAVTGSLKLSIRGELTSVRLEWER